MCAILNYSLYYACTTTTKIAITAAAAAANQKQQKASSLSSSSQYHHQYHYHIPPCFVFFLCVLWKRTKARKIDRKKERKKKQKQIKVKLKRFNSLTSSVTPATSFLNVVVVVVCLRSNCSFLRSLIRSFVRSFANKIYFCFLCVKHTRSFVV